MLDAVINVSVLLIPLPWISISVFLFDVLLSTLRTVQSLFRRTRAMEKQHSGQLWVSVIFTYSWTTTPTGAHVKYQVGQLDSEMKGVCFTEGVINDYARGVEDIQASVNDNVSRKHDLQSVSVRQAVLRFSVIQGQWAARKVRWQVVQKAGEVQLVTFLFGPNE